MTKAEIKAELQKLIMGMHQGNKDARLDAYAERVHGLVEALTSVNETPASDSVRTINHENAWTLWARNRVREALAKFRGAKGGQNEN